MSDLNPKQRFNLTLAALVVGATLLVMGGRAGDVATQTAGGTVLAAVVSVFGYKAVTKSTPTPPKKGPSKQ